MIKELMMPYFFSDIDHEHEYWHCLKQKAVSKTSLDMIDKYIKSQELVDAEYKTLKKDAASKEIRSTKICWLKDQKLLPVYQEIASVVRKINDEFWRIMIEGWEPFQYGEYRAENNGHYDWHIDTTARYNGGDIRKVSFSLGLSEKHEYDGGAFELKRSRDNLSVKLGRGELMVFPSYLLHRVAPVTRGVRKTLVGWGRGPNFV